MSDEQMPRQNNDKVLYREKNSDHVGAFDDSLFVTDQGGIGINVAGAVYVKPLKVWHQLEAERDRLLNKETMAAGALQAAEKRIDALKLRLSNMSNLAHRMAEALEKSIGWMEPVMDGFSVPMKQANGEPSARPVVLTPAKEALAAFRAAEGQKK